MANLRATLFALVVVVCGSSTLSSAAERTAAIASAHPLATEAGRSILAKGGNAFDAAIAVAAALAVVEPYSSGLGGGGFFLLHRARDGKQVMVDARETAPAGARVEHYVDREGRPIRGATRHGGTAVGIPGLPAGLVHLAQTYGTLPLATALAPATRLAREGFAVDKRYARIAGLREAFLQGGVDTQHFLDAGKAPVPGFALRQPDLATTLERLGRAGRSGFYEGSVARSLVETVNAQGGAWQLDDLSSYRVVEREPVRFSYREARITAAALPSAGGIALAQALGILERFRLQDIGEPATDHLVVEALRRAFRDRTRYLADPDFVRVDVARLVSRDYIHELASGIDRATATDSSALRTSEPARAESPNTTHFSIVDSAGNRVAATVTINLLFGAGIVARGTGVLLNNEMDDFSVQPDVANAFQLRGSLANRIEPRKRPLSSMTPTFVEDEKGVLVLGAPGGSRIVSQVLLAILEYVRASEVDLEHLVGIPRYHHQFWPDRVEVEPQAFGAAWRDAMKAKGHTIHETGRAWGNMQVVFKAKQDGAAQAASDPRGEGVAWY